MDKKQKAKDLMIHYFSLIAREAGINWGYDNHAEIGAMVDLLFDAAVDEAVAQALRCIPSSVLE